MFEWMAAIDAAIQGVPDKAEQRMRSSSVSYRKVKHIYTCIHECVIPTHAHVRIHR